MRILDFFDGFSSSTEPVLQFIAAGALAKYADDASYEAAKGSPGDEADVYWNTTTKIIRVHDGSNWTTLQGNFPAVYEQVTGVVNSINQVFTLSQVPVSDAHILIFVNGDAITPSEYSRIGNTITFVGAPIDQQQVYAFYFYDGDEPLVSAPTGTLNTPTLTVSATDLVNKYIELPSSPIEPTKLILDYYGVGAQENSVDFQVIGDQVHWNGLGLDGFVEENDQFRVIYYS